MQGPRKLSKDHERCFSYHAITPKKDKVGQYDVSFDAHQGSFGGKTGFRSIYV